MSKRYRVRHIDASGRPITGVGPDAAQPGDVVEGPQPDWLIEQGYLELVDASADPPRPASVESEEQR